MHKCIVWCSERPNSVRNTSKLSILYGIARTICTWNNEAFLIKKTPFPENILLQLDGQS